MLTKQKKQLLFNRANNYLQKKNQKTKWRALTN